MGASNWIAIHWFDTLQTIGIVGGLLFTAYSIRKDEKAHRIGNAIAINDQYVRIWRELYVYPHLARILEEAPDLATQSISAQEELFVNMLVIHLSAVHRAMKHREFVKLEGLEMDVKEFFSLPIPKTVWNKTKPFQDAAFVKYVDGALQN